ncbi:hypothetical protein CLOM_g2069 [Closterium sp. NIES-68]|nr:hypothetical protein CLOM_g2069 [Closterium sp. NIES-68]GJP62041.1 hypothetical protein CLOP_g19145 [Closterium sp. NIES-67]
MAPRITLLPFAAHLAISFFVLASGELDVVLTRYQAPVDALCVGTNRTAAYGVPLLQSTTSENVNLLSSTGTMAADADFLYIGSSALASQRSCLPDSMVDVCIQNSPDDAFTKISLAELPANIQDSSYVVSLVSQNQIAGQDVHLCTSNDYPRDMVVEGAPTTLTVSMHSSNVTYAGPGFQATLPPFIDSAIASYLYNNFRQKAFSRVYGAILVTRVPKSVSTTPKWATAYLIYRLIGKPSSTSPEIIGNLFYASYVEGGSATKTSGGSPVSWGKIAHRRLLQDAMATSSTDTATFASTCIRYVWLPTCNCWSLTYC